MNDISPVVKLILSELSAKMEHSEAVPDLAISLFQSYLDDDEIPEGLVLQNKGRS
mgnify:FL=1